MLIYNSNKEFIGIDEKDLRTLGFSNLGQLKAESEDFADLFMRTTGYIHNFEHVHWIDYVECADAAQESKVIIKVNGASFEAHLTIQTIYLSNNPSSKAYAVDLNQLRHLSGQVPKLPALENIDALTPAPAPKREQKQEDSLSKEMPLPTLMERTFVVDERPLDIELDDEEDLFVTPSPAQVEQEQKQEEVIEEVTQEEYDDDYEFDPEVASEQLGLPVDLIEEFIQDFIAQAKEFKDELYESLAEEDIAQIATLSHKLKGVAANLRVENALNTLAVINESKDLAEIKSNLKHFYHIIAVLAGEVKASTKSSLSEEGDNVSSYVNDEDEDEFILEFKEDSTVEVITEKETKEEDEFILELDEEDEIIEVLDEDVPAKIEMPELDDDVFLAPEIIEEEIEKEEELFLEEEIEEIEEEKIEEVAEENEIVLNYPKEMIANSIGLDLETFEEVLEDYVTDTKDLSLKIHNALENGELNECVKNAKMIKGMSESIHMKSFDAQIECLIQADNKDEMISAIKVIDQVVKQISKKV